MNGVPGLLRAVALTALGGVLALVAAGRVWSQTTVQIPAAAATHVSVTGNAVEPSLSALAIAILALAAGLVAARGVLRRIVGVVIVAIGAAVVAVSIDGRGAVSAALTSHEVGGLAIPAHGSANAWWVLAAVGGLLAVVAGVLAAARSGAWAAMGRKYDAPSASRPVVAKGDPSDTAWDALDRGEDPTADAAATGLEAAGGEAAE